MFTSSNTGKSRWVILALVAFSFLSMAGCKSGASDSFNPPDNSDDPKRCELVDLGEASDIIPSGKPIPDNQLVKVQGITDPKTLVWQDAVSKKVFSVGKIMGTGGQIFYSEEIPPGKEPRPLSEFEGTILRWTSMPKEDALPMAKAFEKQWGVKVDFEKTYIVKGGVKPAGCK